MNENHVIKNILFDLEGNERSSPDIREDGNILSILLSSAFSKSTVQISGMKFSSVLELSKQ